MYAIRAIKRDIEKIKADNVAYKLCNNDYSGFWDAVKKYNRKESVLPQKMGDIIGERDICDEWKKTFFIRL